MKIGLEINQFITISFVFSDVTSDLYTSDDVIPSDMLTNDSSRDTIENEKEDNVENIPTELVSEDTSKSNDDSENVYYDATQEMDGEKGESNCLL